MKKRRLSIDSAVAVSSPRALRFQPRFWLAHTDYLAVLGAGGLSLLGMLWILQWRPGIHPDSTAGGLASKLDPVFLLFFLLLVAWSVGSSLKTLSEVMVNRSIARLIEAHAEVQLEKQQRALDGRIDFASLWQLVPANTSKPEPAMVRCALQILKEGQDRRFDARFHLLEGYRGEGIASLLQLERLQTYSLRLGILGTFLGLILALGSFSTVLANPLFDLPRDASLMHDAIVEQLKVFAASGWGLVSSLKLAFGTSIEGLVVAFFIAFQAEAVRRRQGLCFQEMEDAALSLVALASRALQRDDLLAGLEDASQSMRSLRGQVYDQSQKLGQRLVQVEQRVTEQTNEIRAGLAGLTEAREKFEGFLRGIAVSQDRFLKDLAALYDAASMRRLFQQLEGSMAGLEQGLSAEVRAGLKQLAEQFGSLSQQVTIWEKGVGQAAQAMTGKTEALKTSVGKIESQVATAAAQSHRTLDDLSSTLRNIEAQTDRTSGLIVLDAKLLRKVLLSSSAGLILGAFVGSGNALPALAGVLAGPGVVLALSSFGGKR